MLKIALVFFFLSVCTLSCKSTGSRSGMDSLVNRPNPGAGSKNIAFVSSGSNEPGRKDNALRMRNLFQQSKFNVQVFIDGPLGKARLLELTQQKAGEVGPNGTLIWYFNTHGGDDGKMYLGPGNNPVDTVTAKEVMDAMLKGRNGKGPIKRIVFIVDTCYSEAVANDIQLTEEVSPPPGDLDSLPLPDDMANGSLLERNILAAISAYALPEEGLGDSGYLIESQMGKVFTEAIVLTSANRTEESIRPTLSTSFVASVNGFGNQNPTIERFLKDIQFRARESQHPTFKAFPSSLLSQKLF